MDGHCELPLRSQIKWHQTTRHHTMPGKAAIHLSQVTAPSVPYQIPLLNLFSEQWCHFHHILFVIWQVHLDWVVVAELQMGPPQRITVVTHSHHQTHGSQINVGLLAYWVFPRRDAFPAQWCSVTPTPPANQFHQLCLRLTPGGWALTDVPTTKVRERPWCPEPWLMGRGPRGPCHRRRGHLVPTHPPWIWCRNAKHHPETAGFRNFLD